MSGKLLLFGFKTPMEVLALVTAVKPLGVELVSVTRADYGTPLGVLAGEDPAGKQVPYTGAPLNGRMIVLCGVENRLDDEWCTLESVLRDNAAVLELAKKHDVNFVLIDGEYAVSIDL